MFLFNFEMSGTLLDKTFTHCTSLNHKLCIEVLTINKEIYNIEQIKYLQLNINMSELE